LLGFILSKSDAEAGKEALEAFMNLSPNLTQEVVEQWAMTSGEFRRNVGRKVNLCSLSSWVLAAMAKILNGGNWANYSARTVERFMKFLQDEPEERNVALGSAGIPAAAIDALNRYVFNLDQSGPRNHRILPGYISCGIISVARLANDWTTKTLPAGILGFDPSIVSKELGGAFKLAFVALNFSHKRTAQALIDFRKECAVISTDHLGVLPETIRAMVPIQNDTAPEPYSSLHLDLCTPETNIDLFLSNLEIKIAPPYGDYKLLNNVVGSKKTWENLAVGLPSFVSRVMFEPEGSPLSLKKIVFIPALVDVIKTYPDPFAENILRWGVLSDKAPDLLRFLRARVRDIPPKSSGVISPFGMAIVPFLLEIPEESHMLPIIARAMSEYIESGHSGILHGKRSHVSEVRALLEGFGLSKDLLRSVVCGVENTNLVRAGALAVYWIFNEDYDSIVSDVEYDLSEEQKLYEELVDERSITWLTSILVWAVLSKACEQNRSAMRFATLLLQRDSDGRVRHSTNILLDVWSERSAAPLSTKNLLPKWLGYSSNAPSYAI